MRTTDPTRAARLPSYDPTPGRRRGERLRGFLALVALLALVGGVPWALWTYGGTPWPSTAPGMQWLTQPIGPEVVVSVLVAVLWVAWLHFVVCLLVEVLAERRGSGSSPHVPGGSVGTQSLARRLVASVLLLVGSATITVPAASAVTVTPETTTVSSSAQAGQDAQAEGRRTGPSREAGSGAEARAEGRSTQAGGSRISYTVQPPEGRHYDSLWDIADRYLGDGRRYKEVYRLNQGKLQADGRTLREADLIHPGWVLAMPDDAKGPGLQVREQRTPARGAGGQGGPGEGAAADRSQPAALETGGAATAAVGGGATSDVGSAGQTATRDLLTQYGVGGALLAAGLLAGLGRRRGWWSAPTDDAVEDEVALRLAADGRRAELVDRALRGLAHRLAEAGRPMPSVYAARLDHDTLSLSLSPAVPQAPPTGWSSDEAGRTWSVHRDAADALRVPADVLAPYPGLVSVGRHDDDSLALLELETAPGIVALGGHVDAARDVAVSMAVELATNLWSDDVSVTLVGFGDDLTELAPDRLRRADNLDEVLDELDEHRRRQHRVCVHEGFDSVIRGRQTRPDRALWKPQFLVLSGVPSRPQVDRLAELAGDPRHAVGVLTIGDIVQAPWRLVVSADGRLTNHLLDLDVAAQRLPTTAYARAVELFRAADAQGPAPLHPDGPGSAPVPAVAARLLDLHTPAEVEVRLLGQVSVDAPGALDPDRRELSTEIVAHVALHPDGVHPSVLDSAVWPRGVTDEVRNAALGHVQRWLGADAAGEPRLDRDAEGRWRLDPTSVRVDWHVFGALIDRARRPARTDQPAEDLAAALSLVRGPALGALPAHRYAWLARSAHLRDIHVAVVDAARRLAERAADAGDHDLAGEALRAGLAMVPACEELWRDLLRLTQRFAGRGEVAGVADELYAAVAAHGSARGATAETDALVDELLPGYRRRAA